MPSKHFERCDSMIKSTIFLLNTTSVLSVIYFIMIAFYSGIKTSFLWFWPFLAVCAAAASFLLRYAQPRRTAAPWRIVSPALMALVWLAFLVLFFTECRILRSATDAPEENAEYMIILGAQVRGDKPSLSLQARIDTAAEYLLAHPAMTAICSGGQGKGENKSEAAAIRDGLLAAGVSSDRIFLEEASTSTAQNLRFCQKLLPSSDTPVVIVTNDFHCHRAGLIAEKCGYENASTLAAGQFLLTTPHYFLREFFALLKDFIVGNL